MKLLKVVSELGIDNEKRHFDRADELFRRALSCDLEHLGT